MKGYVHLRGAGREVTTIQAQSAGADVISAFGLSNIAVSGFTVTGGRDGIRNINNSNVTISANTFTGNSDMGILNQGVTATSISGNIVSSEFPCGTWMCRHFSITQVIEK